MSRTVAVAVLPFLLALGGCRPSLSGDQEALHDARADLVRRLEAERPFRPWFSGVAAHVPCPREAPGLQCRTPSSAGRADALEAWKKVRAAILPGGPGGPAGRGERQEMTPGEARLVALGLVLLDGPGDSLESLLAASRSPALRDAAPEVSNDLAALHLVRFAATEAPEHVLAALELTDLALERNPGFAPAHFNRALALEELALWSEAAKHWSAAAASAESPGWALEAADRRAQVAARPARGSGDGAWNRRHAGEVALGLWGRDLLLGRQAEAEAHLAVATAAGEWLAKTAGDRLLLDAARRAASARPSERTILARGHALFQELRGDDAYAECQPDLERSLELLSRSESPFALWVLVDLAICDYFEKRFASADARLAEAVRLAEEASPAEATSPTAAARRDEAGAVDRPYPILRARTEWIGGLLRMTQGRFSEALVRYERARSGFLAAGERGHAVYLHSLIGETYRYLGAAEAGWRHRLEGLRGRASLPDRERFFTVVEEVVETLQADGRSREALPFLAEQLASLGPDLPVGQLDLRIYTLLDRAEVLAALGRTGQASADVRRARGEWARLPAGHESRRRLEVEIAIAQAQAAGDPLASIAALDRGIAYFAGTREAPGDRVEVLRLRHAKALVRRDLGEPWLAVREIEAALEEVESQRIAITEPRLRASFLFQRRRLFDLLASLQLDVLGDPGAALGTLERRSHRVLLDRSAPPSGGGGEGGIEVRDWSAVRRELADSAVLLRYGALGERYVLWTVTRAGMEVSILPVSSADLGPRLAALGRALGQDPEGDRRLLLELAGQLVPERLWELPRSTPLILVPDESMTGVPFAALRGGGSGEWLGERFLVTVAPSIALHRQAVRRMSAPAGGAPSRATIIANPAFDRRMFPGLPSLRHAAAEGAAIAALHPGSRLVGGPEATESAVLASLASSRVVHFAGHALTAEGDGLRHGLLLASDEGGQEEEGALLRADELAALELPCQLVVLAGCSTGTGRYPGSQEISGLVGAFLAAGVPAVVASLWDVEDAASAAFFQELHREIAGGSSFAEALRQAQARMRRHPRESWRSPRVWAAFQLFGANGRVPAGSALPPA